METKSTKNLIREKINEELLGLANSSDREQRMRHLDKVLSLKLGLGSCDEIDGGELQKLIFGYYKLKDDISLSRSQEMADGIVDEYRGEWR